MATNKINNKKYIGQTKHTLEHRKNTHRRDSTRIDTYFYRAIRKYGFDNFEWSILEQNINTQEELNCKERYYINFYGTFDNKEKGYNSTSGGDSNYTVTKEECKRRSERVKGSKNPMYGKAGTWSGKKFSEKHRENLSKSLKGKNKGKNSGGQNYNAKSIINLSTGEKFNSIAEAAKKYNCTADAISNNLRGKTSCCKGCKWAYLDEIDIENFSPIGFIDRKKSGSKKALKIKETNETFESLTKACKAYNWSLSSLSQVCSKHQPKEWFKYHDITICFID